MTRKVWTVCVHKTFLHHHCRLSRNRPRGRRFTGNLIQILLLTFRTQNVRIKWQKTRFRTFSCLMGMGHCLGNNKGRRIEANLQGQRKREGGIESRHVGWVAPPRPRWYFDRNLSFTRWITFWFSLCASESVDGVRFWPTRHSEWVMTTEKRHKDDLEITNERPRKIDVHSYSFPHP